MSIPATARALLASEAVNTALNDLERRAVERCITAPASDDETRRDAAHEARAVRNLRKQLHALSKGDEAKQTAGARV